MEDHEKRFVGVYVDAPTVKALRDIARKEFDGNVSMTVRRAVREAAERRGLVLERKDTAKGEVSNA